MPKANVGKSGAKKRRLRLDKRFWTRVICGVLVGIMLLSSVLAAVAR